MSKPPAIMAAACQLLGHQEPISSISWSPDAKWLAACDAGGAVNVWSSRFSEGQVRPRFHRQERATHLTRLAWSPDSKVLAAASTTGTCSLWEGDLFDVHAPLPKEATGGKWIRAMSYGASLPNGVRQLAMGGEDNMVRFLRERGKVYDGETGLHARPVTDVAWVDDGRRVASATAYGTIGLWLPFDGAMEERRRPKQTERLKQAGRSPNGILGHFGIGDEGAVPLTRTLGKFGFRAHKDAVTSLSWGRNARKLASAGLDGAIRFWDVEAGTCEGELLLDEAIFHIKHAAGDDFLVVQTSERIAFVSCHTLEVVWDSAHPVAYDQNAPLDTCRFDVDQRGLLAVPSARDDSVIDVWQVDFQALLARARKTLRPYRSAGVAVMGSKHAGKTSLCQMLARGTQAAREWPDGLRTFTLDAAATTESNNAPGAPVHELVLWDPPGDLNSAAMSVYSAECSMAVFVLRPADGTEILSSENVSRWTREFRATLIALPRVTQRMLVVVNAMDVLVRQPSPAELATLQSLLDVERVILASAASGEGIEAVRLHLLSCGLLAEHGNHCEDHQAIQELAALIDKIRSGHPLVTMRELKCEASALFHGRADVDLLLRSALKALSIRAELHHFEFTDDVIVEPHFHRAYASALFSAAHADPEGMGRLSLAQARAGVGEQIRIPSGLKLATARDAKRLFGLTIGELDEQRHAKIVAADGVSYIVLPGTLTRTRDDSERSGLAAARTYRVQGAAEDAFTTLVVRLLGQAVHYPERELWKNEATFQPARGGACNIRCTANPSGGASLLVSFAPGTDDVERRKFLLLVAGHLKANCPEVIEADEAAAPGRHLPEMAPDKRDASAGIEVYVSWRHDASHDTEHNVAELSRRLADFGIRAIGGDKTALGLTEKERADRMRNCRTALVLLSRKPARDHLEEYALLERRGVRMIPVILPNAPRTLTLPPELRSWESLDLRDRLLDIDALASGIKSAWTEGPRAMRHDGHVFLSYFSEDRETVRELVSKLNNAGHDIWWDQDVSHLPPGAEWDAEFKGAIESSYAHIVCIPAQPRIGTSWVYAELKIAADRQNRSPRSHPFIFPVRLGRCDADAFLQNEVGIALRLQHFDYFGKGMNAVGLAEALDAAWVRHRHSELDKAMRSTG